MVLDSCCPFKMEYGDQGMPGSLFVLQNNTSDAIKEGCVMDRCVYIK